MKQAPITDDERDLLNYRMDCLWKEQAWVKALKSKLNLPEFGAFNKVENYYGGMFVAHRDKVKQWPKSFYVNMLDSLRQIAGNKQEDSATPGRVMEHLWHVIFAGTIKEATYKRSDFTTDVSEDDPFQVESDPEGARRSFNLKRVFPKAQKVEMELPASA